MTLLSFELWSLSFSMGKPKRGFCLVFFLGFLAAANVVAVEEGLNVWPMPQSASRGSRSLYLIEGFGLNIVGGKYKDKSGILKDGFQRLLEVVESSHDVDGKFSALDPSAALHGLNVAIQSPSDELQYGIDESYKLSIAATGNPLFANIEAQTVYGALHGLQTFSQLCYFNFEKRIIEVHRAPWDIRDKPRFSYRGLLIDTARHFQPVTMIKKVIDAMAYTKLNVLHWHIVDTQSFPLEIPSYPKLWNGAYTPAERYTIVDAAEIVEYAQRRGINVLPEIDVPGHARSWGTGYPFLWPSPDCKEPLDVSNEFTFKVIDGILSDFSKVFKFKFAHLGGDEVHTGCWNSTRIRKWLKSHKFNQSQAYEYFVLRTQKMALSHGYEPVNWEETFNNFGKKLNPKTVVHNWLGGGVAQKVTAAGLRCIVSNQQYWYLDHLDTSWEEFYSNEPLANISNHKQQKLVIGGEVCMWGELVDASDLEQTIWPRAAAAAERLWTPLNKLAKDPTDALERLAHFRCLLNQRGVAAAPLSGVGRSPPLEPGPCIVQ